MVAQSAKNLVTHCEVPFVEYLEPNNVIIFFLFSVSAPFLKHKCDATTDVCCHSKLVQKTARGKTVMTVGGKESML